MFLVGHITVCWRIKCSDVVYKSTAKNSTHQLIFFFPPWYYSKWCLKGPCLQTMVLCPICLALRWSGFWRERRLCPLAFKLAISRDDLSPETDSTTLQLCSSLGICWLGTVTDGEDTKAGKIQNHGNTIKFLNISSTYPFTHLLFMQRIVFLYQRPTIWPSLSKLLLILQDSMQMSPVPKDFFESRVENFNMFKAVIHALSLPLSSRSSFFKAGTHFVQLSISKPFTEERTKSDTQQVPACCCHAWRCRLLLPLSGQENWAARGLSMKDF